MVVEPHRIKSYISNTRLNTPFYIPRCVCDVFFRVFPRRPAGSRVSFHLLLRRRVRTTVSIRRIITFLSYCVAERFLFPFFLFRVVSLLFNFLSFSFLRRSWRALHPMLPPFSHPPLLNNHLLFASPPSQ